MTLFDDVFAGEAGVANQLIDRYGIEVTYRRVTKTYSASTGKNTGSNTDSSPKMTPPGMYKKDRIGDSVVEQGDIVTLISGVALSFEPSTKTDFIVYNNQTWQVLAIEPVVSGVQTAAYILQLRR